MSVSSASAVHERTTSRWLQLLFGFIAMMSISSPQYVWTVFVEPFRQSFGADTTLAALQFTPSLLIILQTFFSPFQAYLVERFGPRALISLGALMSGLCWVLSSQATNIYMLYVTYGIIGGFGTGIVYVGIIGLMVRWFPDRRGLATGVAAAGYGFGAFFTSIPITGMVASSGHVRTLVVWGIAQAVVGVIAALNLRTPPEGYLPASYDPEIARTELQSRRSYTTHEMLGNPIFYLLFVMMTMMSTGGFPNLRRGDGAGLVADALARHQRPHPSVFRLDLRPYRPGEHHGARLLSRGRGDPGAVLFPR